MLNGAALRPFWASTTAGVPTTVAKCQCRFFVHFWRIIMATRRTFVPRLETLEDRCVPAPMAFNGGSAEQIGSVLTVNVTSPADTVFIIEDGSGDVWAQWNGWLPNGFSGITNVQVNGAGSSNTVFFLN